MIEVGRCVVPSDAGSRACAASRPGQPGQGGRAARRRPDHRGQRHRRSPTTAQLADAIRASPRRPGRRSATSATGRAGTVHGRTSPPSQRTPLDDPDGPGHQVSALGVGLDDDCSPDPEVTYGPVEAFGATADYSRHHGRRHLRGVQADPGEGPGAVDLDHRRRARPGHPDQRGRRQPARRRGGRRTASGRSSSCCLHLAERLHRHLQPAAAAAARRRPHRHRLVRAGPLLDLRPAAASPTRAGSTTSS